MKRGQNSYKKSHSKVDFDLKHDSEKELWEGDSKRGVGEKGTGFIQKELLDLNTTGGEMKRGFYKRSYGMETLNGDRRKGDLTKRAV
ncbi:hypothetical protein TNCT_429841 [Trichonephila clavata]|uniref:Uncharacterized protein n=1 Tax=Trichonephila clavata TaxID=2740835 RepID=A0A8X6GMS6_TRICU|nr:hypothetical protein TNCT_429841 [Trichonephila clavata]